MGFSAEGARETLLAVRDARRTRLMAEAAEFRALAEFADQYRWLPDDGPVLAGTERLVQWGGAGTPSVAEFCTLEVAAMLQISEEAARAEITAALAVRGRFPRLWGLAMAGELRVWKASQIASLTKELTLADAEILDQELSTLVTSMHWNRVRDLVKARVLEFTGGDAQDEHADRMASRHVRFGDSHLGVTDMQATLGAADAVFLNATLDRVATILGHGGSQEPREVRRAIALGVLASPARALQLLQASLTDELPEDLDTECPAAGQRGHTCGQVTVAPQALLPRSEVIVHLTDITAATGSGLVRGERIGPLLAGWLKDLLGDTQITVRPVLDANGLVATDAYECPPRMREALMLRNSHEVFPFSGKHSRGLDVDHTQPWAPPRERCTGSAPPTRLENLGPLSRKVHRAKTHGNWDVAQPLPGYFLWTSPLGFGYLVTPSRSWMVEDPTGRVLPADEDLAAAA